MDDETCNVMWQQGVLDKDGAKPHKPAASCKYCKISLKTELIIVR